MFKNIATGTTAIVLSLASPTLASAAPSSAELAICRAEATEYANSQANRSTEPEAWQGVFGTYFTDCIDQYETGYRPGEGACTSYPCGRY